MARLTGLEPATPGVTGRYSNQLSYNRASAVVRSSTKRALLLLARAHPVKHPICKIQSRRGAGKGICSRSSPTGS